MREESENQEHEQCEYQKLHTQHTVLQNEFAKTWTKNEFIETYFEGIKIV